MYRPLGGCGARRDETRRDDETASPSSVRLVIIGTVRVSGDRATARDTWRRDHGAVVAPSDHAIMSHWLPVCRLEVVATGLLSSSARPPTPAGFPRAFAG